MCSGCCIVPCGVCDLACGKIVESTSIRIVVQLVVSTEGRPCSCGTGVQIGADPQPSSEMMAPPVIVSRVWCYRIAYGNVGCAHLCQNSLDLVHQVCCSIVGVRGPVVSQSADRVTVRVRVVRIKIDIIHEGR